MIFGETFGGFFLRFRGLLGDSWKDFCGFSDKLLKIFEKTFGKRAFSSLKEFLEDFGNPL